MSYKGYFKPRNPNKYRGDPTNIVYRSRWELKLMMYLDTHPDIIAWGSEEVVVPYVSPIDGRFHRYFPDFVVRKRGPNGVVETLMIEVKPFSQTIPPKPQKNRTRKYLNEVKTWGINTAKWLAAEEFCADRQWKFIKMTEKELGIKY